MEHKKQFWIEIPSGAPGGYEGRHVFHLQRSAKEFVQRYVRRIGALPPEGSTGSTPKIEEWLKGRDMVLDPQDAWPFPKADPEVREQIASLAAEVREQGGLTVSAAKDEPKVEPEIEVDDYHWHEALDRTSMICDTVDRYLLDHPVIQGDPLLNKKMAAVVELLSEVYQYLGNKHL